MVKCVIWGTEVAYEKYINLIHYQELIDSIKIVGVTSNSTIYRQIDGYKFIEKDKLNNYDFDAIIITADLKFLEIIDEIVSRGLDKTIIRADVLGLPNFDIRKYIKLYANTPTIFSNNCWAGFMYHRLGLQFKSPTINMIISDIDYIKFLKKPQEYLAKEIVLEHYNYSEYEKINYPVCSCGDIMIHFVHYTSFDNAVKCWNNRKQRIDWENLFVMMYTEDEEVARQFSVLPYEKKVCFVPFETKDDSLFFINYRNKNEMRKLTFSEIVNGIAIGNYKYYNVLDFLADLTKASRFQ